MTYPHDPYIKFLMLKGLDHKAISDIFKDQGVICPTEDYLIKKQDEIIAKCDVPVIRKIVRQTKVKVADAKDFISYMESIGVRELWLLEKGFNKDKEHTGHIEHALEMFNNTKRRDELNCFILNKMKDEDIEKAFLAQYNLLVKKKTVDVYKKIFFNMPIMKKIDWIEYLRSESTLRRFLYLTAMNEDSDRLKYELGFKTKIEYVKALDDVFATAYFKFKQSVGRISEDGNEKKARAWAKVLFEAGEKREKIQSGNMGEFSEALQMQFTFDEDQFPTYADLNKETHDGTGTTGSNTGTTGAK